MTTFSTLDMMSSFWRDFGVGAEPETEDQKERYELARTILRIYDRHDIAKVGYTTIEGQQIPVKLESWDTQKSKKTLADVLNE